MGKLCPRIGDRPAAVISHLLHLGHRYKAAGATFSDLQGNTDIAEFINVSKDDALAYPASVHRTYPEPVQRKMSTAVKPFIQKCVETSTVMLRVFEKKLGLKAGELLDRHQVEKRSICESRCIKVPAAPGRKATALGAHTDFGRYLSLDCSAAWVADKEAAFRSCSTSLVGYKC
mgnify:CR=1 FL=1